MTQNNSISQHTLSVYVANKPGVLSRIAQTFARRGYNIESLVVSSGRSEQFSRMTIGVSGDPDMLEQIIKQLMKLIDVVHCKDHTFDDSVVKELGLVKMLCSPQERSEALQIAEHFGCKTVDLTKTSMILMITGSSQKIDALMEVLSKFEVIELVRTGKVVMARGGSTT
jgi:acetolactate synthase-1/3 small subunit